jgi:hypothetical protein
MALTTNASIKLITLFNDAAACIHDFQSASSSGLWSVDYLEISKGIAMAQEAL